MPDAKPTSYLSADEVAAVQVLHQGDAPYVITGISRGMFSLARHAGGVQLNGFRYVYMPQHDECIREDVLRLVEALRRLRLRAAAAAEKKAAKAAQAKLPGMGDA